MNPDEALWKVTINYNDRRRKPTIKRRQTHKQAQAYERWALNDDSIASVRVERETGLK